MTSLAASQRWHDVAYWAVLAVICATFLVMNMLTTLKEDDMGFTLVDGEWTPIKLLADVLRSIGNHYMGTNGRTADLVALLFSGILGKSVFNVCNTLVFGLMAHLLSLMSTGRRSILVLVTLMAVVGCCYPVPGETMLWLAGSCNYMWAITASLLLVYYLLHHSSPMGWGRMALIAAGAVIAGSFNEATSIGFLAGLCLYYAFNRRLIDHTVVIVLMAYLAGVVIIVASPAAWQRAASGGIVVDLGLSELLSSRWLIFSERVWRFVTPVAAFVVMVVMLIQSRHQVRRCVWSYVFICLALLVIVLGIMHERIYAPLATVSFIIMMMFVDRLLQRFPQMRSIAIVAALALGVFTWARGIKVLNSYQAYEKEVTAELVAAPRQAVLRMRTFNEYSRFIKPVNYISTNFFAQEVVFCGYYDKDNVQFVSDSIYERYHTGRLLDGATRLPLVSDRPDLVDSVLAFSGQDYMAVVLHVDTIPHTFQTARYYMSRPGVGLTDDERQRREDYGLVTDYNPCGFYPLRYQGMNLLIFPLMTSGISQIVFPIELGLDAPEVSLSL